MDELGSVAQIAYNKNEPVAFIEYVSAEKAQVPISENRKTALIPCIYKPRFQERGVGTMLVQAALERLRQLDVECVKTVVSRHPEWITGGIYYKNGFRHEKTFYKSGCVEPLDLLTLNLQGAQTPITEPTAATTFAPPVKKSLPIEIVCFNSGQCPFNKVIYTRLLKALEKFDAGQVLLKVYDSRKNWEIAREYGPIFMDIFINGKAAFFGPPSQGKIEEEIVKEIERIEGLR